MVQFNAIVARSNNNVIGIDGKIPWHFPLDFKWFKRCTLHRTIVMGKPTFDSIGKPLPHRKTIVLSTQKNLVIPDVEICGSIEELKKRQEEIIWVCGGAKVYQQMLPLCKYLYITMINHSYWGDKDKITLFPDEIRLYNFVEEGEIFKNEDFTIARYINKEFIKKDVTNEWPF